MSSKTIAIFDTETNGLSSKDSVLSLSMLKAKYNIENNTLALIDTFDRFYYPIEAINLQASEIHGLTLDSIKEIREAQKANYANHHIQDNIYYDFLKDVDVLIAHNLKFDIKFYPETYIKYPNLKPVCTMEFMKHHTNLIDKRGNKKAPKLIELSNFLEIKTEGDKFHGSSYDVKVLFSCLLQITKKYPDLIRKMLGV
jgi:DNA polymerase III alpha subunit (gram-positive type)